MMLVNIGFGSMLARQRVMAVLEPDSAPIKRLVQETRDQGLLIDASYGRKTQSVIVMDTGHVVLSALSCEQMTERMKEETDGEG